MIYHVDIPMLPVEQQSDAEWRNIARFETYREAQLFLERTWGIKASECGCFISEGEGEIYTPSWYSQEAAC